MSGEPIHPSAIVHRSAVVAPSARLGPYCVIGPDVVVGEGTVLHDHVTVQALTVLGAENRIYPYAVIGADPQDRKWRGERTTCEIGDRNVIREHVTVHRGTENGGGVTSLGHDNLIMVAAHVAHDCRLASHVTLANQVMLAGHVCVESYASIGGGAGVHHFATVGAYSFVGGLARISKDVPPYMIVEGNPAEVRAVNTIAMQRGGCSQEEIDAVKDAYRLLYRDNGVAMSDKLPQLRREYAGVAAVQRLCEFLEASSEGVHGRAAEARRADDKRVLPHMRRPAAEAADLD